MCVMKITDFGSGSGVMRVILTGLRPSLKWKCNSFKCQKLYLPYAKGKNTQNRPDTFVNPSNQCQARKQNRLKPQHFFSNVYEMIWKQKEGRIISRKVQYSFFKQSILTWTSFSFPLYSLFYRSMFSLIFVFVFGGFLSQIVTDLSKLTVGRLRPSFMAACKANLTGPGCQGYVTRDVCTGDLFEIKLARYEIMWLLWSKTRELPCQGPCYQRPLFPGIK